MRKGKLVALPTSPSQLLTTRLLSNGAKLAIFGEPMVEPGDSPMEESVATFVRRRFNQEVLDYVVNPFVGGIFAGDPEQLSARHALPRLHDLEHTHGSVMKAVGQMLRAGRSPGGPVGPTPISFVGGLQEMPDALGRELRPELRFKAPATQIRLGPKGWTVNAAYQAAELYDAVIYAAPAHCADEVDLAFEGGDRVKTLTSIDHPPVGVLALGFRREDVAHKLDGFGFLVPDVERRNVLGVDLLLHASFPAALPTGTCCSPRSWAECAIADLANADLSTLTARVLDDLRLLLGVRGEPTFRAFHLWPKAIPQYALSYGRFKEIMDDAERRNAGFALAGSYREGVAVGDVITSAAQAADRIAAHLGAGEGNAGR